MMSQAFFIEKKMEKIQYTIFLMLNPYSQVINSERLIKIIIRILL